MIAQLQQAVRSGDWKAVRLAPGAALELYNLRADPGETNNLASVQPEVVERIEQNIREALDAATDDPSGPPGPPPSISSRSKTADAALVTSSTGTPFG